MKLNFKKRSDFFGNKRYVAHYLNWTAQIVTTGKSDYSKYGKYYIVVSKADYSYNSLWTCRCFDDWQDAVEACKTEIEVNL